MTDIYQEIVRIRAGEEEAALVTIVSAVGSTPREEGAKMLVRGDGSIVGTIGGGRVEALAIKAAFEVVSKGKPQRLRFSLKAGDEPGMACGGNIEVFIEPILSTPTLFIFGGGHVAFTLARIGKLVGFRIVVIDSRPEYANARRFPDADLILAEDFMKAFSKIEISKSSYVVIVTHDHKSDEAVLEKALASEAKYIGMIGSKNKNATIFSHLLAKQIPQKQLDRVQAPIGLQIGAQTPEEIAVSILAEVIKIRRLVPAESAKRRSQ
ncbi:XdhC family protein [Chloroflexota bacterium]